MKTSDSISVGSSIPSLFQIAAFFEDFFPSTGLTQAAKLQPGHLPFAEYMLNPEKLMAVLKTAKGDRPATPAPPAGNHTGSAKRGNRSQPKKSAVGNSRKPNGVPVDGSPPNGAGVHTNGIGDPPAEVPKKIAFSFKSRSASSVKLAGDFTDSLQSLKIVTAR